MPKGIQILGASMSEKEVLVTYLYYGKEYLTAYPLAKAREYQDALSLVSHDLLKWVL